MLLVAGALGLTLGSPLLFRQTRIGLNVKTFTIVKFRTMTDSRDASGTLLSDEQRLSPFTRFIRRTRLDELPQLLAILSGDMSFIGPRPLLPSTILAMDELGHLRCAVRPGLSGCAQVNGNTQLSDRQKLALDIWYVDHKSNRLDLLIVIRTLDTLLRGERLGLSPLQRAEAHMAACYPQFSPGPCP